MIPFPVCKKWIVLAVAVNLMVSGEAAEEPGSANGTNQTETIERVTPSKVFRPYRPFGGFSSAVDTPQPVVPPPAPRVAPSRRTEELLDRQKNWIFATPGDKPEEEAEGIFDNRSVLDDKRQGLLEKFLSNGQESFDSRIESTKEPGLSRSVSPFGLGNNQTPKGNVSPADEAQRGFSSYKFPTSGLSDSWRNQQELKIDPLREAHDTRMTDFQNLFRPKTEVEMTGTSGLAGNRSPDLFQIPGFTQPAPVAPSNFPERFQRGELSVSREFSNPALPRSLPGADLTSRPDINERVFGPSTEPPVKLEDSRPARQPAVLPFPKRNF